MTALISSHAGVILKRLRLQKYHPDGQSWTQSDLAEKAGLSPRTVRRYERGEGGRELHKLLDVLEPDYETRRKIEEGFNPYHSEQRPLDDVERWKIKKHVREFLSDVPRPLPAFIMDEYGFMRAQNVYMAALHDVTPQMLALPASWHPIAIKFQPELKMSQLRGPHFEEQRFLHVKNFRDMLDPFQGTTRYIRLLQWLKTLNGFEVLWNKASAELLYDLRVRSTRLIPVFVESRMHWWRDLGVLIPVSPQLADYRLNVWVPQDESKQQDVGEILRELKLNERACCLGYSVETNPYLYIDDYLSQEQLQSIGAWID